MKDGVLPFRNKQFTVLEGQGRQGGLRDEGHYWPMWLASRPLLHVPKRERSAKPGGSSAFRRRENDENWPVSYNPCAKQDRMPDFDEKEKNSAGWEGGNKPR